MHKKLEADLISLAHSILTMKNKDDVFALKEKSKEIYEKLSMLAFVEEYVNTTPNLEATKETLVEQVTVAFETKENTQQNSIEPEVEEKVVYNLTDEPEEIISEEITKDETQIETTNKVEEIIEQPFDDLENILFGADETIEENEVKSEIKEEVVDVKSDVVKVEERKTMSLEDELQDIVSVDVMADLFENTQPKSLNDKLATSIQIGLNDRIAFVKHLFNNKQEDYNRVISQLNTFKSEKDAKTFIKTLVKPDYNWSEQEELETRFMEIISRKFV